MIARRGLPPVIWWLFGLLVVAALSVSLGGHDADTNPSTSNYDASGEAALFSLLSRAGYTVASDQRTDPKLGPHDVAICLHSSSTPDTPAALMAADPTEDFYGNLTKFVESGGRAVIFRYASDFGDASQSVMKGRGAVEARSALLGKTMSIMSQTGNVAVETPTEQEVETWLPVWRVDGAPIVQVGKLGKGSLVVCDSSIPATNRFLDKADDAQFVVSVIRTVAQPGDRLVFTEGSFGNISDPGFFELLGTWALSAWRQAIVLFVVLVFTLGRRFGYPEERRRIVQSSQDLAGAFGDLLRRARRVDLCLQMALTRLDNRTRRLFRVPRDASVEERNRVLPESVFAAIQRVEEAARDSRTRGSEALKLVQAANREIDEYSLGATPRSLA